MERINKIYEHPLWKESLKQIEKAEQDRIFCRHGFSHFLDVARIAYIENLEKDLNISKELIYAAALLHDIGRHLQYQSGTPHEQASAELAEKILPDCGFDKDSQKRILMAIGGHRNAETSCKNSLGGLIYRADKKSRNCMFCSAAGECNRKDEKKNLSLSI